MKKSPQSLVGVTLLEIMLVLAIAAMVIVMSIRYYQSASNNQKIAAGLNAITSIIAGGESVLGAVGNLKTVSSDILPYLPKGEMPNSPWGGKMAISTTTPADTNYSFTMTIPEKLCPSFLPLVTQNSKLSSSTCSTNKLTVNVME